MPPPPDASSHGTPLAPSVEKAYYRKCIELKRRLTEVEAANDEAKIRRVRLDRAIMKMRLERAFLLDELRKRMDHEMVDSEGSGDEGVTTPPVDRPHRDKRRRQQAIQPSMPAPPPVLSSHPHPHPMPPTLPSQHGLPPSSAGYMYAPPPDAIAAPHQQSYPGHPPQGSPYGAPVGLPMNGSQDIPTSRGAAATGEALSAGSNTIQAPNGERRVVSSASAEHAETEQQARSGQGGVESSHG